MKEKCDTYDISRICVNNKRCSGIISPLISKVSYNCDTNIIDSCSNLGRCINPSTNLPSNYECSDICNNDTDCTTLPFTKCIKSNISCEYNGECENNLSSQNSIHCNMSKGNWISKTKGSYINGTKAGCWELSMMFCNSGSWENTICINNNPCTTSISSNIKNSDLITYNCNSSSSLGTCNPAPTTPAPTTPVSYTHLTLPPTPYV